MHLFLISSGKMIDLNRSTKKVSSISMSTHEFLC